MRATNTRPGRTLEPFVWYLKSTEDFPHIRTLDTIRSLSDGVAVLLEILEADDLNDSDADCFGSVLSPNQVWAQMRLAIAASNAIREECDRAFEWTERHCIKAMQESRKQATWSP